MIFVFWFALDIGLRQGRDMDPPFYLWLVSGLIPWFFMKEMLRAGSSVLNRYSYLVTKIKFPLSGISSFFALSSIVIHIGLTVLLIAIYFGFGMPLDIYLVQIPIIMLVMLVFFTMYSIMTSLLSALSKDFANTIKAFITPLFWLSGIIFPVADLDIQWIKTLLLFNPITFFASAYRDIFYYKAWIWEDVSALLGFGIVFLVTLIVMLVLYKKLHKEVPDAL